jgi:hypothetical protein
MVLLLSDVGLVFLMLFFLAPFFVRFFDLELAVFFNFLTIYSSSRKRRAWT